MYKVLQIYCRSPPISYFLLMSFQQLCQIHVKIRGSFWTLASQKKQTPQTISKELFPLCIGLHVIILNWRHMLINSCRQINNKFKLQTRWMGFDHSQYIVVSGPCLKPCHKVYYSFSMSFNSHNNENVFSQMPYLRKCYWRWLHKAIYLLHF